ncbi:DUF637 domain-containing protein [Pseudoalteromonas obscura]|uniref:DUF637 domain-containing protein n=1 Tax=Pseudoalteromonas obscura TaxID=3048491 RepID=A0ABT7EGA0_9GAMM|nr:DUF637 domain-containing protein [Pseudoalteromonas sp. P94(2023)]MDK2593796.1 DUF637 domain-containing protein [Pseudoalteromonas sp. P94(2023)]
MKKDNLADKPVPFYKKAIAYLNIFMLLGQVCLPTLAQAYNAFDKTNANQLLASSPAITKVPDNRQTMYVKSKHVVEQPRALNAQTMAGFHQLLLRNKKHALPAPKKIHLAGSSITVIFPNYPLSKQVGDRFVQSRLIRSQIYAELNRNMISTAYADETAQITQLYQNAYELAGKGGVTFGEQVPKSVYDSFGKDFIWPEFRDINGEKVLSPVVHLSASTIETRTVNGHLVEFTGSDVNFRDITVNNGTLLTGRDTYLRTARDLTVNPGAQVASDGDLNLFVGGTLRNHSGNLSARENVKIIAGQYEQKTLVHRFSNEYEQGTRFGQIASVNGENISIYSMGDLVIQGGTVSGNTISLRADGNIQLISQQTTYVNNEPVGEYSQSSSEIKHLTTKLSAKDSIYLMASGAIELKAAELYADEGVIELLAGQGVYILNEFNQNQSQKSGKWGKTTEQEQQFQTMAIRSALEAGKGVRITSQFGDVTLQAAQITSGDGASIEARNGQVKFLLAKEQKDYFYNKVKKGTWKIKTETKQDTVDTAVYNEIIGGVKVHATHGITLELGQYEGEDISSVISGFSGVPSLSWMQQLHDDPEVNSNLNIVTTELTKLHIDKSTSTLSPAAMAVIAIAVSVAMGPAGAGLVGNGGTISAAFQSASMGAAMSAGAVTLTTQAVSSLAAGNSVGDTLNSMLSSESIRALVISMATAGMMSHFSDLQFFGEVNPDAAFLSTDTLISVSNQATQAVVNSTISAGISTVINGGDFSDFAAGFTNSLKSAGISAVGEYMSSTIGSAYRGGDITNSVRYLAHAGAGCILGIATSEAGQASGGGSESCLTGAGGAVVGELIADTYKAKKLEEFYQREADRAQLLRDAQFSDAEIAAFYKSQGAQAYFNKEVAKLTEIGVDLAKLGGATAALIANSDVNLAAMTAENAAQHNAFFLIPLGLLVLKGIDIALTANELHDIYDTMGKNPTKGEEMLQEWLVEQAAGGLIGKAIPGFKSFEEMLDWLKRNDVLSPAMLKDIEDNIASGKQGKPSGEIGDIKVADAVKNRLDLSEFKDEHEFLVKVDGSHVADRNDGFYGEQIAKQLFEDSTGIDFKDIVKNKSNHGADLLGVDPDESKKTIWLVETKSSYRDKFPNPDKLNLEERGEKWIEQVATGKLNGQEVTPEAKRFAEQLQDLIAKGYTIKPILAKVSVPEPGKTGTATVKIVRAK